MAEETRAAVPDDVDSDRFSRLEGTDRERADAFLRNRVAFTAREWAVARLCADFRTKTGVEMTTVGEHLPELVPFMREPYSRQAVYEARRSFEDKVREAAATVLYGGYSGFFTPGELDDILYEATEVSKLLLEVEGASVPHGREDAVEERLKVAMREVHDASAELRYDSCPHCGEALGDEALDDDPDDVDLDDGPDDETLDDDGPDVDDPGDATEGDEDGDDAAEDDQTG